MRSFREITAHRQRFISSENRTHDAHLKKFTHTVEAIYKMKFKLEFLFSKEILIYFILYFYYFIYFYFIKLFYIFFKLNIDISFSRIDIFFFILFFLQIFIAHFAFLPFFQIFKQISNYINWFPWGFVFSIYIFNLFNI